MTGPTSPFPSETRIVGSVESRTVDLACEASALTNQAPGTTRWQRCLISRGRGMSPSILRFIKSPHPSQPKLPCEAPKFVILSTILGDVPRRFEGYWTLLQPRIKNFRPLDKHVAFPLHFLRVAVLPSQTPSPLHQLRSNHRSFEEVS